MFSYCGNNPVSRKDPSGFFVVIAAAALVISTTANHIVNAVNEKRIDKELEESHSRESALEAIEKSTSVPAGTVKFDDNQNVIHISDSINIKSRYERQKVSMILDRTEGLTDREYDNMSAEWLLHNALYNLLSIDLISNNFDVSYRILQAQDADLDYVADDTPIINIATAIFEVLGWE